MAADAMFPKPTSPAGRVLAHLVSSDVPGTPLETTLAAVAEATRLEKDDARRGLAQLEKDGFVLTEPADTEADDLLTVTVLLAPPLEDYGITPRWGASTTESAKESATAFTAPPSGPAPSPTPEAAEKPAKSPPKTATKLVTTPAPLLATKTVSKTAPKATKATKAAVVDETAVLRSFVERFEHMLVELEEWKKRALTAEQQIGSIEKLLRSAERRAETAEQQVAAAQERTQSWTDLTRRMQELARKAESGTRRPAKG